MALDEDYAHLSVANRKEKGGIYGRDRPEAPDPWRILFRIFYGLGRSCAATYPLVRKALAERYSDAER